MAVEVVFFDRVKGERLGGECSTMSKVGHSCLHFMANVDNGLTTSACVNQCLVRAKGNVNVRGFETEDLLDDDMVIYEHNAILFTRPIAVKVPAGSDGLLVEGSEERLFDIIRDGHVILDSIKSAENHIEEAYLDGE